MKIKQLEWLPFILFLILLILYFYWNSKGQELDFWQGIIIVSLVIFAILLELIIDLKNRNYTTIKFIVVIDIGILITFLYVCYLEYSKSDYSSLDLLFQRAIRINRMAIVISILQLIRSILKIISSLT